MHFSSLISTLSIATLALAQSTTTPVTGKKGDAVVVNNNPAGAVYTATLPNRNTTNVRGSFVARSAANGTGVTFTIRLSGFPTSGGPFLYHLHDQPVPANGNCTATLAHLDPTERGEVPPCDPTTPAKCQVGDLSGKYGKITSDPFTATFTDPYAALVPGLGAFFGNRSVVVHFSNTTRITCANFVSNTTGSGTAQPSGGVVGPSSTSRTTSAPGATYTGAAAQKAASLGAVVLAAAALVL